MQKISIVLILFPYLILSDNSSELGQQYPITYSYERLERAGIVLYEIDKDRSPVKLNDIPQKYLDSDSYFYNNLELLQEVTSIHRITLQDESSVKVEIRDRFTNRDTTLNYVRRDSGSLIIKNGTHEWEFTAYGEDYSYYVFASYPVGLSGSLNNYNDLFSSSMGMNKREIAESQIRITGLQPGDTLCMYYAHAILMKN